MAIQGYVHARDRFFQMDLLRRTFSGTLAELVGPPALPSDVQLRTLGLRRGAEASWATISNDAELAEIRDYLLAYSSGVNTWLAENPLPPEYAPLELATAVEWTPVDSLVMAKGLAFGLSFGLEDIDFSIAAEAYVTAGQALGFDGLALFSEDLFRSQPMDPAVTVADSATTTRPPAPEITDKASPLLESRTAEMLRSYRRSIEDIPLLKTALERSQHQMGSNWWILSGEHTASGHPILANDPHLGLDTPAIFYENHLLAGGNPGCGLDGEPAGDLLLDSTGVSFAGIPGVVLGCNSTACWGATTNPLDVTDVYLEELVVDFQSGAPTHTVFRGVEEPVVLIPQTFLVNQVGDGTPDNLADAGIGPLEGGFTVVVPRRNNGPIVNFDLSGLPIRGISVQYTGWGATTELEAFRRFMFAESVEEFRHAVQFFDVGSQNFGYADIHGNIAYFSSAEMPLREDLQNLNAPDGGIPPFFLRDGTGALQHEWLPVTAPEPQQNLPFQILPYDEMPQAVNPASGVLINANNDPVGTTLDNNPLNQVRPGGGLYYLNPGYANLRAGRIERVLDDLLADGHQATTAEIQATQANNQLLDAEIVLPYLLGAFDRAAAADAPAALQDMAADAGVAEAIGRLGAWDYSTPTGIQEGFDPGDDPANLPEPSADEVAASIAATIWSTFRGQAIRAVVDATVDGLGLGGFGPGSREAYQALEFLLRNFDAADGFGASGVDFFESGIDGLNQGEERDYLLLAALRSALDLLAGDAFAAAFGGSTDQDDYRWGRLHRIVLDHPLGGPFNIPAAGGFTDLAPDLPGISRSGGYQAVDASSHSARADGANDFMFGSGPARRFVGELDPDGIDAYEIIPGGQSGVIVSPHYASQLGRWLTNGYHSLPLDPAAVAAAPGTDEPVDPATPPCVASETTLCLLDGRFEVSGVWQGRRLWSGPPRQHERPKR